MSKVQPISGFPEFLPAEQLAFNQLRDTIRHTFELFGFLPLETPAVERTTTLLAKGAADKEIYGLRRLQAEDEGAKELGLRFDLTVPLARYVAQNYGKLTFPYRRYHIAPVWRGERAQAGRYRQFYQCDIDVIGDGKLSLLHDAELPAIICQIFEQLNVGPFTVRVNNRKLLQGLLAAFGAESTEDIATTMRVVDDLEKLPQEKIIENLSKTISKAQAEDLLTFFSQSLAQHTDETLEALEALNITNETFTEGLAEVKHVITAMRALGVHEERFTLDPTIARGLGYYTGTIYETRIEAAPELGSICSGGRYENLAENFTNKPLPGVGISIGLNRLAFYLIEKGLVESTKTTLAPILVTTQVQEDMQAYLNMAKQLREAGLATEVYTEPRTLPKQLKFAQKRGFTYVLIANEDELKAGTVNIKHMGSGEQTTLPVAEAAAYLQKNLSQKKLLLNLRQHCGKSSATVYPA